MVDLDDFVSETLRQIIAGIAKAQAAENGGNVNAAFAGVASGNLIDGGSYGLFSRVDFDVAVTAEASAGGKASVKVWSVGAEGGGEKRSQTVSRVSFSVPVRLPDGDQSKADEVKRKLSEGRGSRGAKGDNSWMAE